MGASRKRMLVLCPYPVGVAAGQRLKFEQYYDDWRSIGWEITVSPFMDQRLWSVAFEPGQYRAKAIGIVKGSARRFRDLFRIGRFDLVYCFMYGTPLGTAAFERLLRRFARRLIYDVEDNVVTHIDRVSNDDPNPLLRFLRGAAKYRYLIREADHVVASSPDLEAACAALNKYGAATYISSSLDTERFVPAKDRRNKRKLTIGWTGTFSSRSYLELIAPRLQELARRREFKLRIIGNFDYQLPGVDLEVIRWTAEREVADLQALDVGLYPLREDDWVSGKSGLKAITYMAMGIPCAATAAGTTPMIIRDEENGMLLRSMNEWLPVLERLLDDPELRRRLGRQARRDAVAKYSTKVIAARYREVLASVMEK